MIRLNNTPNEGSTVKVNLGFRDSAGQYYIPTKVQYTFLALNNDKESWSIVDDIYLKSLNPASSVVLTIPNIKAIEGTTLQRKVMVYWEAFVDNEYNTFTDEITFDIAPKPYIPDEPVNPPPEPTIYVKINQVNMQIGTLTAVPLQPVFLIKTNLPVDIENAVAQIITQDGEIKDCTISVDSTGALLTVSTEYWLEYQTSYTLKIGGLVSTINHYVMEKDFECAFATQSKDAPHELVIEDSKTVDLNTNGTHQVLPDPAYDGVAEVIVRVDVQPNLQEKTVTENGEVTPDTGYDALSKVTVDVQPPLQEKTVTQNGEVTPDSGYYGLSKVDVEIPIETGKTLTVNENGTTTISPESGYAAMEDIELTVAVPGPKPEQTKSVTIAENGTTTVEPDEGKVLTSVEIETALPIETGRTETITENGTTTITPATGNLAMEDVELTVAVPIETERSETYEHNGTYTISPSTGNVAMDGVEVNVDVPIETGRTETYEHNGTYTIEPNTDYDGIDGVEVEVAVPLETGKTETFEHNGTYSVTPSTDYDGIADMEVTVDVPLEANKTETISVDDYTAPVEITPTAGNDGMEKTTVILTNMTRLYVWKDPNATPNPHYMYTTYPDTSKCDGHAYQCGTVKNALLTSKNVEANGEALYVSGYPNSLYYRDPDSDIEH